jgi:hypothetical protein
MTLTVYLDERVIARNVPIIDINIRIESPHYGEVTAIINEMLDISESDFLRPMNLLINMDGNTILLHQCRIRSYNTEYEEGFRAEIEWLYNPNFTTTTMTTIPSVKNDVPKISWLKCGF